MPDAVLADAKADFEVTNDPENILSTDELIAAAQATGAEALVVTVSHRLDAAAVARLPSAVKIVATETVGFDHLDVAAARARGISMTYAPDVLTDCVADFTILLLLAACRKLPVYEAIMREGWGRLYRSQKWLGMDVRGKRLGIVGLGRTGQAVAERARSFGMEIHYTGPRRKPPEAERGATFHAELSEMLPQCQILSLHAPADGSTDRLMDAAAFAALPGGAVFINVSRGSLVDEDALLAALSSGHLYAAGLDVFRGEPSFDRRFSELPNVVLTPHVASAALETRTAMALRALRNVRASLADLRPPDLLG